MNLTYVLIYPHRKGMLALAGVFHRLYEASQYAHKNNLTEADVQLWRVSGDVPRNYMRCHCYKNWLKPAE